MDVNEEWDAVLSQNKEEEILKLTVAENLSDIERALVYIESGHAVQLKSALDSLPDLVRNNGWSAFLAVVPHLVRLLLSLEIDDQVGIARSLALIAADKSLDAADLADYLLPVAFTKMCLPASEKACRTLNHLADAWVRVALAVIPQMERAAVNSRVVPFALARAQAHGQTTQGRLMCCALLGAAAVKLSREDIELQFLQKAVALCQDTDKLVRQCMCEQLPALALSLGCEPCAAMILPEILELAEDEERAVRCAAILALGSILHLLPPDLRRARTFPFLRALCTAADISAEVQRCVARLFCGQLIQVAADMDSESDVVMLLAAFRSLSAVKDAQCRACCAAALPTVLQGATPRRYSTHLHGALTALVGDPEVEVRAQMAGGFHECASLLGRERCVQYMRRPLLHMLGDESAAVREAAVRQLPGTLELFAVPGGADDARAGAELAQALASLDASLGLDWRSQEAMLLSFPALAQILSGDQIYEQFLPIALRCMAGGAAPTRSAAAGAAVAFLRCMRKPYQRTELLARLLRDFARGRSCSHRLITVDVCHALLRLFSARFFKAHVLNPVLELLSDGVVGVRLRAAGLLPLIRQTLTSSRDAEAAARLDAATAALQSDPDRDVRFEVQKALAEMDRPGNAAQRAWQEEDRRKEEEEADMQFLPEELERLHNEDTPEKRRLAAAAATAASARRGRAADAAARAAGRLPPGPSGAEACLFRSISFKRTTETGSMSQSSAQAGAPASSVVLNGSNGIDTSPGAPKTAKTAGWAAAKGKGSDAARLAARLAKLTNEADTQLTRTRGTPQPPAAVDTASLKAVPPAMAAKAGAISVSAPASMASTMSKRFPISPTGRNGQLL